MQLIQIVFNQLLLTYKKLATEISEDQHGYVETSIQRADYLKLIGPTTEEEDIVDNVATDDIDNVSYDTVSNGVKLQDNPSYSKIK